MKILYLLFIPFVLGFSERHYADDPLGPTFSQLTSYPFYSQVTTFISECGFSFSPGDRVYKYLALCFSQDIKIGDGSSYWYERIACRFNVEICTPSPFSTILNTYDVSRKVLTNSYTLTTFTKCFPRSYRDALDVLCFNFGCEHFLSTPSKEYLLFDISSEPAKLNNECFQVIQTNSMFEAPCNLSSACGPAQFYTVPESWWGKELLVCYSIYPIREYKQRFSVYKIPNENYFGNTSRALFRGIDGDFFVESLNLKLSPFEPLQKHFYLVYSHDLRKYNFIPKVCLMAYQKFFPNGTIFTSKLSVFRRANHEICYEIPSPDTIDACYNLMARHGGFKWNNYRQLVASTNPLLHVTGPIGECTYTESSSLKNYSSLVNILDDGTHVTFHYNPYSRVGKDYLNVSYGTNHVYSLSNCVHIFEAYKGWGVTSVVDKVIISITSFFITLFRKFEREMVDIVRYLAILILKTAFILLSEFPPKVILAFFTSFTFILVATFSPTVSLYLSLLVTFIVTLLN